MIHDHLYTVSEVSHPPGLTLEGILNAELAASSQYVFQAV